MFSFDDYCLKNEVWNDIPGYEGIYQASSLGRIRTVDGKTTHSKLHGIRVWKGKILRNKTLIPAKSGYMVTLWKDKKQKDFLVARLVCMTFHGVVDNKMTVNHKDGNRYNNDINNLEWLTMGENIQHGFETGLYDNVRKTVILEDEQGKLFKFDSMSKASCFLGKNKGYLSGQIKRNQNVISKHGDRYSTYVTNKVTSAR